MLKASHGQACWPLHVEKAGLCAFFCVRSKGASLCVESRLIHWITCALQAMNVIIITGYATKAHGGPLKAQQISDLVGGFHVTITLLCMHQ